MSWESYWDAFRRYHHALYITNVSKEEPETHAELNYQFLATVSIRADEFRPDDLPGGWDHSPAEDTRNWLTKETELAYYNLCANEQSRQDYFLKELKRKSLFKKSREYYLASILKKNPLFINEPVYARELESMADKILKQYAVGRLIVAGDNRYLSGDLLDFLVLLLDENQVRTKRQKTFMTSLSPTSSLRAHFTLPALCMSMRQPVRFFAIPTSHVTRKCSCFYTMTKTICANFFLDT